jgi:GTPase
MNQENQTVCGTVALIGRPNVGKSTILNRFLGQKLAATTHKPQTTQRKLRGICTRDNVQVVFIDTPGLHEPQKGIHNYMVTQALEGAREVDLRILVVEAWLSKNTDGHTVASIDYRDQKVLEQLRGAGVSLSNTIMVINKIDVLPDKGALLPLLQKWAAEISMGAYVPVSAMKGEGIDQLWATLSERLPSGSFLFPEDMITDASEKDIARELIREKAMLELKQELVYRVAVEIESFDETRREDPRKPLIQIEAVVHVESEGHKRMVIGKQGSRIKQIGLRARQELENLLGCQVMLKLFVRVEPKWSETEKGIRKVGYR